MGFTKSLKCVLCGATYNHRKPYFRCSRCGGLLDPQYDLEALADWFDLEKVSRRERTIWKWKEFLPIEDYSKIVSLGEGGTPLLKCEKIAEKVGVKELYVKDDAITQPTGSLKDRSVPIAATKAREFGFNVLTTDSSGNKAASVAAYASRAGLKSIVFCPAAAPKEKLVQMLTHGASVIRINTDMSGVHSIYTDMLSTIGSKLGWYDCGTSNPFRYDGKKTYAYEVMESLNWDSVPDWVFHPAGGSLTIHRTLKGYNDLRYLGLIDEIPRIVAVQAELCAPIVEAFLKGKNKVEEVAEGDTIATGIKWGNPGDLGDLTLKNLRESSGRAVSVTEDEIIQGIKLLGKEGIFSEPAGAVGIPAVKRLMDEGTVDRDARVVCDVTGYGFKDVETILKMLETPKALEPELETVEKYVMKVSKQ
ncbi:MAG: threonine synthase [Nitrososphaeria archaeon]|nr:threonine synthase [Nitrososphaeria archaeon]NIQ32910.1 threonine synthase [Nitrososphaeria archaeon]